MLLDSFMLLIESLRLSAGKSGVGVPIVFENRYSLATDIRTLQPITAAELLKEPGTHPGTVLLCRTVTDAYTFGATHCIVQDIRGTAIPLVLNTFEPRIVVDPDPALPKGTLLAIKEPRVVAYAAIDPSTPAAAAAATAAAAEATAAMVWADMPCDAIELDAAVDAALLTALGHAAWTDERAFSAQERGDVALRAGDAKAALRFYAFGLGSEPADTALLQGKAESLLRLGRGTEAYDVLQTLIRSTGDRGAKTTQLLAEAAAGAGEWAVAADSYKQLIRLGLGGDPDTGTKVRRGLDDALRRVRETQGEFDFVRLVETKEATATFIDPRLHVREAPGKGQGVFTDAAIPAGTLLIAEPAFAAGPEDPATLPRFRTAGRTRTDFDHTRLLTVLDAVRALRHGARGSDGVYALWAGDPPPLPPPAPRVAGWVDPFWLGKIVGKNAYYLLEPKHHTSARASAAAKSRPSALFPFISRINHACCSCATYFFIGRTMFVRAIRPIAAGEEITDSYLNPRISLAERTKDIAYWGFTCDCALCVEQRADAQYGRRQDILDRMENMSAAQGLRLSVDSLPWLKESVAGLTFAAQHAAIWQQTMRFAFSTDQLALAYDVGLGAVALYHNMEMYDDLPCITLVDMARLSVLQKPPKDPVPMLRQAVDIVRTRYGFPRALWPQALGLRPHDGGAAHIDAQLLPLLDGIGEEGGGRDEGAGGGEKIEGN